MTYNSSSQGVINGSIIDKQTKETLIGASVVILNEKSGTATDFNGNFSITYNELPITIECSYIGYENQIIQISDNNALLIVKLSPDKLILDQINIIDSRLTEKLKQSPITIEAMDVTAIKEAPSSTFYESIGNLKGVDLTSASLGFKIINTRGFNSTSPVRSLQIIDGVDNQSPGLNFSLGNFLGTTELDTKGVEIIVGANSALYGPNAFNGVINMSTKDPFMFPGTSYQIKMGQRSLTENCFRYATNKEIKNDFKLGFKINLQQMKANDWEANNTNVAYDTNSESNNPGGYDAVNTYGDEYNRSYLFTSKPGMGTVHRTGYTDSDLVDYDTENLKFNTALHLKWSDITYVKKNSFNNNIDWFTKKKNNNEFIYSYNYGNGTTIYHGDNRISLRNIQFFQNRLEFKRNDNFFIRIYSTHEDAGDSYDAVATAVALLDKSADNASWYSTYSNFWSQEILELMENDLSSQGYISKDEWIDLYGSETLIDWMIQTQSIFDMYPDLLQYYHDLAREHTNGVIGANSFLNPNSEEFDDALNEIITQTRYDEYGNLLGGTKFYDKSSLYHIQTEKKIETNYGIFKLGGSGRLYKPESNGSIFNDSYDYINVYELDENNDTVFTESYTLHTDNFGQIIGIDTILQPNIEYIDTVKVDITNYEFGVYFGYDHSIFNDNLLINATMRIDKNQNFDYLLSPATSMVYKPNDRDIIRLSLSSAVRNPTLTDQYFDYNQGQAILIGNLNGFGFDEYFVNTDSLLSYLRGDNQLAGTNPNALRGGFIKVNPIQPEEVKTAEVGFRTTLFKKIYIDASYYYSVYKNFIGYQIGATYNSNPLSEDTQIIEATQDDVDDGFAEYIGQEIYNHLAVSIPSIQVYRVAANAKDRVTAQGFSIGFNYYMNKSTVINGNYSWNKLVNQETKDPLVPAYNTPEHKFNIGISNKFLIKRQEYNMSINYKWQEGFVFEGSPQFTGEIPSYGLIDTQINRDFSIKNSDLMVKLGASNILNNQVYQAYGGPTIGRLAYISLTFEY